MIIRDILHTIEKITKKIFSILILAINTIISALTSLIREVPNFLKYNYKNYESGETYRNVSTADDLIKSQY